MLGTWGSRDKSPDRMPRDSRVDTWSSYNKVMWLEQFVLVDRYGVIYIDQSDSWDKGKS